jgi:hypothetical protein
MPQEVNEESAEQTRNEYRVDPWRPKHFLGKKFPEQSRNVETMEGG